MKKSPFDCDETHEAWKKPICIGSCSNRITHVKEDKEGNMEYTTICVLCGNSSTMKIKKNNKKKIARPKRMKNPKRKRKNKSVLDYF